MACRGVFRRLGVRLAKFFESRRPAELPQNHSGAFFFRSRAPGSLNQNPVPDQIKILIETKKKRNFTLHLDANKIKNARYLCVVVERSSTPNVNPKKKKRTAVSEVSVDVIRDVGGRGRLSVCLLVR